MEWTRIVVEVPEKWEGNAVEYCCNLGFSVTHFGGHPSFFLAERFGREFDSSQTNVFFYFENTKSKGVFLLRCKENCITPIEYRKIQGLTKKARKAANKRRELAKKEN